MMRTERKGLLALFSVRQGKWIDLLREWFGCSFICTLVPWNCWQNWYKRLQIVLHLDINNSR